MAPTSPSLNKYLTRDYISSIKSLQLKANAIIKGSMLGLHSSPFRGYSSEFFQYRSYSPGDPMKYFDWKIYGKNEKKMIRQFKNETNARVYVVLDSSKSMAFKGEKGEEKLEYAKVLGASIAMLAHQQRDAFSFIHGANNINIKTELGNSNAHLKNSLTVLEKLNCEGQTELGGMFNKLAPYLKSGSMCFVFSDFWQDPSQYLNSLKKICHKSAITLVQVHSPEESAFLKGKNLELVDMESGEKIKLSGSQLDNQYKEALKEFQSRLHIEFSKLKLRYIKLSTDEPFIHSLRQVLNLKY